MAGAIITSWAGITGKVDKSSLRCWEAGESPAVTVTVANPGDSPAETSVGLSLHTDTGILIRELSRPATLQPGDSARVVFDDLSLTPGFYKATVTVGADTLPAFNLGYDPASIASPSTASPISRRSGGRPSTSSPPWPRNTGSPATLTARLKTRMYTSWR